MAGVKLLFLLCESENNSSSTLLRYSAQLCWLVYKSGRVILAFSSRKFPAPACWECTVCNRHSAQRGFFLFLTYTDLPISHPIQCQAVKQCRFPVLRCWKCCLFLLSWVKNHKNTDSCAQVELLSETNLVIGVSQYPHHFYIFCSIYLSLLLLISPKCIYFSLGSIEEIFCTTSAYALVITPIFVSLIFTSVIKGFH